jgi:hypothetical protein
MRHYSFKNHGLYFKESWPASQSLKPETLAGLAKSHKILGGSDLQTLAEQWSNYYTVDSRYLVFQGTGHFTLRETEFELHGSAAITLTFVQVYTDISTAVGLLLLIPANLQYLTVEMMINHFD